MVTEYIPHYRPDTYIVNKYQGELEIRRNGQRSAYLTLQDLANLKQILRKFDLRSFSWTEPNMQPIVTQL